MIDIHWLNVFKAVYECRSFSRAGKVLALSQPTVSAHVASLEKATGSRLFDRFGRQVLPTQAGELLYHRSLDVFSHLESLEHDLRGAEQKSVGRLRVHASTFPGHCLVPAYLASFLKDHPYVTAQVRISDTATVNAAAADGLCSFGFSGAAMDCDTLACEKIFDDELILVGAPDLLPDAERDGNGRVQVRSARRLLDLPWVMRPIGSATRTIFMRELAARGFSPDTLKIRSEGSEPQTVLALVRQALGATVISRLAVASLLEQGHLLEIHAPDLYMRRPVYMIRNKYRRAFPVETLFWEFVLAKGRECLEARLVALKGEHSL